jgi:Zn-finger nucleic acid-binding protein
MDCPRCGFAMTLHYEGLHEDIPVHRCARCRALWMSAASLDRLDDNINVDATKLDWRAAGHDEFGCAACPAGYRGQGPRLTALAHASALTIHRCPQCDGILLDEPTLDGIQAAVVRA